MKMSESTQLLSHRNRSHTTELFLRLNKLRKEEVLCDLTILVQGQKFKAHKVVMAACSNYFLTAILGGKSTASVSITEGPNGSHMTVELQYITLRGFSPLLDYAYTSELNVSASDVIDVLAAASYMQMFDVARACSNFMRTNLIDPSNSSRLAGLQLLASQTSMMLNGQTKDKLDTSLQDRTNSIQTPMSSLLQATSAMNRNGLRNNEHQGLIRPPMLLPHSSMQAFDANFHPWAGNSQHFISHLAKEHSRNAVGPLTSSVCTPPVLHSSPSPTWKNHLNHHESANAEEQLRSKIPKKNLSLDNSSYPSPASGIFNESNSNPNTSNNNNNDSNNHDLNESKLSNSSPKGKHNDEKQALSDNEAQTNQKIEASPERQEGSPPENVKDTWRNLQRLYNLQKRPEFSMTSSPASLLSSANSNSSIGTNTISPSVMGMGTKTSISQHSDIIPSLNSRLSMLSGLNGLTFHQHLLHRHLLAQQQQQQLQQTQQQETEKANPDLPIMPPSGQYTNVRRRTLQSNVPKPHQCQICGSRFTRYHNLKQHIKLHSGVKPYECDICGKRFTRNYTLRLHKMKHVGVRNFRCGTCAAAFTSLGEFRAHLRLTMHSHVPDHQNSIIHEGTPKPHLSAGSISLLGNGVNSIENSLLNYGVGSPGSSGSGEAGDGSIGTLSPPSTDSHSRIGANISPLAKNGLLPDSPQDLSSKRSSSDRDEAVSEHSMQENSKCCPTLNKRRNEEMDNMDFKSIHIGDNVTTTVN